MSLISVPLIAGLGPQTSLYIVFKQFLDRVNGWIGSGEATRRDLGVDGKAKSYFMAGW